MVKCFELVTQFKEIKSEIMSAVERVLDSGVFILGPEVQAFEKEFLEWNGGSFGHAVTSGTDALHLACRAAGVGPGDEVICPAFTYMATASSISLVGATPVFVDIDPVTYGIDPALLESKISS